MNVLKYGDYLTEKQIINLINESVFVMSTKLVNILSKMTRNRIAQELIKLNKTEIDGIAQNYIDVTDRENLSFTPDRRAQQLIGDRGVIWKCIASNKCLTHSPANDQIFERLEYDKENTERWSVQPNNVVKILSETTSKTSGKVYCKVEELNNDGSEKEGARIGVINKEGISLYTPELQSLWTTARNPLRVGRMARALLVAKGITFADHELSQFTEEFTATFDFIADGLKQFDIVKGDDIHEFYSNVEYTSGYGSLNNSCMAGASRRKLSIYCKNSNVELLVLYGDGGEIVDGKYTADEIKGRAIIWRNCDINGQKGDFMDRIYTTFPSDEELFKQYGEKNGLWWKVRQSYDSTDITNGISELNNPSVVCDLEKSMFDLYPFMDTMYFVDCSYNKVANKTSALSGSRIRECQYTDGTWDGWESPNDED